MTEEEKSILRERLESVLFRVRRAERNSGRPEGSVHLIAVSKLHSAEAIQEAYEAGQTAFGENYVQEALSKQETLRGCSGIEWHCIGHIQSRKIGDVAGRFHLIHTVDSVEFAEKLSRKMPDNTVQPVLIQVNVGEEVQKSGVDRRHLHELAERIFLLSGVALQGLMCIPPHDGDPRRFFAMLRLLRDDLERHLGMELPHLSMGMSADFEQAIEEGATLVRVGTEIFGSRPVRNA